MITRERAYELRALIEKATKELADADALQCMTLFPSWQPGLTVAVDEKYFYNDKLYKVIQAHTTQADWLPPDVPALFVEVALPGEIPVWVQPTGAHDAYNTGDQVKYPDENGQVYESTVDANVYAPGVVAGQWQLVE